MLPDVAATETFGAALSRVLVPGLVVWLEGDLGAGKTTLVRAVLRALGFGGAVKSPTYSLVELYNLSRLCFYHFDFYRLRAPEEFTDAGLADYFDGKAACFIEWPDKAGVCTPAADLRLALDFDGSGRCLVATASTGRGRQCLAALRTPPGA
jgi:tRNA threonylcarbamoyladenosine biosynthesis protein TsaE